MNPEELPRPKGPKVEPIDRRGILAKFKAQRAQQTTHFEERKSESPAEKLHRIKADIAPDVQETREIIAHYLPFVELVEVEQMLASMLGPDGAAIRAEGGFHDILRQADNVRVLNSDALRLGDEVRNLRNILFHKGVTLHPDQISRINRFWNIVREQSQEPRDLAIELKSACDLGARDIDQAKPALVQISPIAYLIEIEQSLRKIRDHLVRMHSLDGLRHAGSKRHADNGDALLAIKHSKGKLSHALRTLGFIDDLWLVVGLRNKIMHSQASLTADKNDVAKIERIWGACRNVGRIMRIDRYMSGIEESLRQLLCLIPETPSSVKHWKLQRLSKRAAEEAVTLKRLESVGITKAKLKAIESFCKKAENKTLHAPTLEEMHLFQEAFTQIQLAETLPAVAPTNEVLPKSKKQALLAQDERVPRKKARKNYRD